MEFWEKIKERFKLFISGEMGTPEETDQENFTPRQKILAITFAVIFSLSLWMVVNMGRDYNISLSMPIEVINLPDDVALSNEIPDHVSVSISGEGWALMNLYSNPPAITVNGEAQQVNLFDQVRQQIASTTDINVVQVDPILLTIETEQRITKKVPVVNQLSIELRDQYGILGEPRFDPDSVMVTGAASKMTEIEDWPTREQELTDISRNIELEVALKAPSPGVQVNPARVRLYAEVSEFTEAEARVPIRTRNLPPGKAVSYNPSSILVKFDVPIEQYSEIEGTRPYVAFVDYLSIESDSTGLITPELERVSSDFDVRLRSFQPTRVSYFNILPN